MSRIYWVNNVSGSDTAYDGKTESFPFLSIDKAVDSINLLGSPGDIIRIVYTGTDYTSNASRSWIGTSSNMVSGNSWDNGEFFTVEGYDPSGGRNRPKLLLQGGSTGNAGIGFSGGSGYAGANYWLIQDLWFACTHQTTSWAVTQIGVSSNVVDSPTYFKIRRCRFDGVYGASGTDNAHGIYFGGGSRYNIEISYCFFYNIPFPFRMLDSISPKALSVNTHHNIYYFPGRQGMRQLSFSSLGELVDYTDDNNTWIALSSSQYAGYFSYIQSGDFSTNLGGISFKNNFVYWTNYMLTATAGPVVANDITNTVGYNTWGDLNSSSAGYVNAFDICETEGNYAAGDYYLTLTHSKADYTNFFVSYSDWTYFWPDSTWMTIPDLRPKGWEMTGTMEDPIAGLRGAIQYSGDYKDSSSTTENLCVIYPTMKLQTSVSYSGVGTYIDLVDGDEASGPTFDIGLVAKNAIYKNFGSYGGISNVLLTIESVTLKSGNWAVKSNTQSILFPSDGSLFYTNSRTQLKHSGPSTDYTSPWSSWMAGSHTNQVPTGVLPGTYNIYLRFWDREDNAVTDWTEVYTYSI